TTTRSSTMFIFNINIYVTKSSSSCSGDGQKKKKREVGSLEVLKTPQFWGCMFLIFVKLLDYISKFFN
ncbi:TPA: hypothetical protein MIV40_28520, partial [Klebsiella pneumoniae]|nr:hypothetical protein [Klebsiella pneumoniae]